MSTYYSKVYNFGGYKEYRAVLEVSKSSTTGNVKTTIKWTIRVQMRYGSEWGVGIKGTNEISGYSGSGYLSSSSGSTWANVKTISGSKTYDGGTSPQTKTFGATAYGTVASGYGSAGGSTSVSTNVTIPALTYYTISYNLNGKGAKGAPAKQTKYYGKGLKISLTKPTRTGYTFKGWALTSGGNVYYTPGSTCGQNKSLTLYAIWTPITYSITYNGNKPSGASGSISHIPKPQVKTYGKTLILTKTEPILSGYSFSGWATSATGSVKYQPGKSYTANSKAILYAKWDKNSYTITFDKNTTEAVSNMPSNQTLTSNYTFSITPRREKYLFVGWGISASSTTVAYKNGDTYSKKANIKLYAIWKANYYTISYLKKLPQSEYSLQWNNESAVDALCTKTTYDKNTYPTYTIDNGSTFKLKKVTDEDTQTSFFTHAIIGFYGSDNITYKLGQTITPRVGNSIILTPIWAEQQTGVKARITDRILERLDINNEPSEGGKNLSVNFIAYPEGSISGDDSDITYSNTTYKVEYSKDNEIWESDVNTTINTPTEYKRVLENFDDNYKYWRISLNGVEKVNEEIPAPSRYEIDDQGNQTPLNEMLPTIINFEGHRISYAREEIVYSFDWTCYYDGHENYTYKTVFNGAVRAYSVNEDGEKEYSNDIEISIATNGESGTVIINELTEDLPTISIDQEAEIIIEEIICYRDNNDDNAYRYIIPEDKQLFDIIGSGGFPLHISSDGEGVTFFGVAQKGINAVNINGPTLLNNTVDIKGITNLNNAVNIAGVTNLNNDVNITGDLTTKSKIITEKGILFDTVTGLYGKGSDDNYYNLTHLSASNNFHYAYGSYDKNFGTAYYNGNNIYIRSKNDIKMNVAPIIAGHSSAVGTVLIASGTATNVASGGWQKIPTIYVELDAGVWVMSTSVGFIISTSTTSGYRGIRNYNYTSAAYFGPLLFFTPAVPNQSTYLTGTNVQAVTSKTKVGATIIQNSGAKLDAVITIKAVRII